MLELRTERLALAGRPGQAVYSQADTLEIAPQLAAAGIGRKARSRPHGVFQAAQYRNTPGRWIFGVAEAVEIDRIHGKPVEGQVADVGKQEA